MKKIIIILTLILLIGCSQKNEVLYVLDEGFRADSLSSFTDGLTAQGSKYIFLDEISEEEILGKKEGQIFILSTPEHSLMKSLLGQNNIYLNNNTIKLDYRQYKTDSYKMMAKITNNAFMIISSSLPDLIEHQFELGNNDIVVWNSQGILLTAKKVKTVYDIDYRNWNGFSKYSDSCAKYRFQDKSIKPLVEKTAGKINLLLDKVMKAFGISEPLHRTVFVYSSLEEKIRFTRNTGNAHADHENKAVHCVRSKEVKSFYAGIHEEIHLMTGRINPNPHVLLGEGIAVALNNAFEEPEFNGKLLRDYDLSSHPLFENTEDFLDDPEQRFDLTPETYAAYGYIVNHILMQKEPEVFLDLYKELNGSMGFKELNSLVEKHYGKSLATFIDELKS